MRAKIFVANDIKLLGDRVNTWLRRNPKVSIKLVTQSQVAGGPGRPGYTMITIWYTEV